jgi:hypothetical protein
MKASGKHFAEGLWHSSTVATSGETDFGFRPEAGRASVNLFPVGSRFRSITAVRLRQNLPIWSPSRHTRLGNHLAAKGLYFHAFAGMAARSRR